MASLRQLLRRLLLCCVLLCSFVLGSVLATRGENEDDSRDTIRVVGFQDGGIQQLPMSYVKSFSRWLLLDQTIQGIPGASSTLEHDTGFVNPTSISDLWWPVDLSQIHIRPTLDVILHAGTPKYAAGGIDVCVFDNSSAEWRNHGMNSQPLPQQWTTFESVGRLGFRVETFVEDKSNNYDIESKEQNTARQWLSIEGSTKAATKDALELLGVFLSGLDDSSPLAQGFHIVSIPIVNKWHVLPMLESVMEDSYQIITLGTALPDARALMETKPDVAAKLGTTILAVTVAPTAPGGESQHLPDVYKPLYSVEK